MVTVPQIKAARALLDWTQADLASAASMHLNVINNIERGTTNPRAGTMDKLESALIGAGIALIGDRGVELKRDSVTMLKHEGPGFIAAFTADILNCMQKDGEVLSIINDIRNFSAHDDAGNKEYYAQKESRGFRERLITRDMPGFFPRHSENYRVVSADFLGPVDTIIYADRTAHIFWDIRETVILRSHNLAATNTRLFEHLWDSGHEPVRPVRAAED
jgi:transcriptional regulator with XRE-family HTH domain